MQEAIVIAVSVVGAFVALVATSWLVLGKREVWSRRRLLRERRTTTLEHVLSSLRNDGGFLVVNEDAYKPRVWYVSREALGDIRFDHAYLHRPLADIPSAMFVTDLQPQDAKRALDEVGLGRFYKKTVADLL